MALACTTTTGWPKRRYSRILNVSLSAKRGAKKIGIPVVREPSREAVGVLFLASYINRTDSPFQ